jgi:hypothetical protein
MLQVEEGTKTDERGIEHKTLQNKGMHAIRRTRGAQRREASQQEILRRIQCEWDVQCELEGIVALPE